MLGTTKNYDIFNGISQPDRFKAELEDAFLNIDDRTLPDFVQFVSNYADQVNFYTKENIDTPEEMKTWGKFFTRDNLFLLIIVTAYDLQSSKDSIQESMDRVLSTSDKDLQVFLVNKILKKLLDIAETLNYIRKNVQRTPLTIDFVFDLNNEIKNHLNSHLKGLFQLKSKLNWDKDISARFQTLQLEWGWHLDKLDDQNNDEILNRLDFEAIRNAFTSFYYTAFHIKDSSAILLENLQNNLKNNKPYISLFLTFIHLFEFVKDIMNGLPKKHLDYYYRDILKMKELPPRADITSVSIILNSKENHFHLPKGTIVTGAKNELGEDLQYKTMSSLKLTDCKVQKLNILYKSRDKRHHQRPYRSFTTNVFAKSFVRQDANFFALDGQKLLGDEKILDQFTDDTLNHGRMGVIVSSSLFRLEAGSRKISVTIDFDSAGVQEMKNALEIIAERNDESLYETIYKTFSTAFTLSISTENGMLEIPNYSCNSNFEKGNWEFQFQLGVGDPAFVPFTEQRDNAPKNTEPFLEILLRDESFLYLYSIVDKLRVKNIHIKTASSGLKDIEMHNQIGILQPNKPFEMLGAIPVNGNYLILGHREAFSKPIDAIKVDFKWANNPILTGGFETYFKQYRNNKLYSYIKEKPITTNYALAPSYLKDGVWKNLNLAHHSIEMFPLKKKGYSDDSMLYNTHFSFCLNKEELNSEIIPFEKYKPFSQDSTDGRIKLTMNCPKVEFGHDTYAKILSETVMHNSRLKKKENPIRTPNQPFVPIIETVEMHYEASGSAISSGATNENPNNVHLYQLSPFGFKQIDLKSTEYLQPFFDTDPYEGNMMLGLDKVPSDGEITLLFDMNDENTNDKYRQRAPILWSYMRDGQWVSLDDDGLLGDTTNGFINSGIVRLQIPSDINRNTKTLDDSLFWIRGSIEEGALNLGEFDGIYENATRVTWDGTSSPIHLNQPLPKMQLKATKTTFAEIDGVIQPNNSYAGKREENDREFYKRISERLRHKGRAVNALDYEELVLQRFPFIEKVKCFMANHTLAENFRDLENLVIPGTVHIAVIPKTDGVRNFKPKVSPKVLNMIQRATANMVSPFVKVIVTNAYYEEIRVNCQVNFKGYESTSLYLEKLQQEITEYLSSWLSNNPIEEEFGKNVYKSDAMAYIQNLDFVDFVTEFSIVKIIHESDHDYVFNDTAREVEFEEEIKVLYPWSILISAKSHNIQVISDPAYASPKPRGIDNMELGMDFIITE